MNINTIWTHLFTMYKYGREQCSYSLNLLLCQDQSLLVPIFVDYTRLAFTKYWLPYIISKCLFIIAYV